jgi:hypothetical protein
LETLPLNGFGVTVNYLNLNLNNHMIYNDLNLFSNVGTASALLGCAGK